MRKKAGRKMSVYSKMGDQDLVKNHGVSIALIEHNYSFVTAVAHTVYVLQDGFVRDQGITKDVLSQDGNREILIGI